MRNYFHTYSDEELALVDQSDILELVSIAAHELGSPNVPGFESTLERMEEYYIDMYCEERERRFGRPCHLPL